MLRQLGLMIQPQTLGYAATAGYVLDMQVREKGYGCAAALYFVYLVPLSPSDTISAL